MAAEPLAIEVAECSAALPDVKIAEAICTSDSGNSGRRALLVDGSEFPDGLICQDGQDKITARRA